MTIKIEGGWVGEELRSTQDAQLSVSLPAAMKDALLAASEADGEDSLSRWVRAQLVKVLEGIHRRLTPVQAPLAAKADGEEQLTDAYDPELTGTEIDHPLSGYDGWTYDDWHRYGGENAVWQTMLKELL